MATMSNQQHQFESTIITAPQQNEPTVCDICCQPDNLWSCIACGVTVHGACYYGIDNSIAQETAWKCWPCRENVAGNVVDCALCASIYDGVPRAMHRLVVTDSLLSSPNDDETLWCHSVCARVAHAWCMLVTPMTRQQEPAAPFGGDDGEQHEKDSSYVLRPTVGTRCFQVSWNDIRAMQDKYQCCYCRGSESAHARAASSVTGDRSGTRKKPFALPLPCTHCTAQRPPTNKGKNVDDEPMSRKRAAHVGCARYGNLDKAVMWQNDTLSRSYARRGCNCLPGMTSACRYTMGGAVMFDPGSDDNSAGGENGGQQIPSMGWLLCNHLRRKHRSHKNSICVSTQQWDVLWRSNLKYRPHELQTRRMNVLSDLWRQQAIDELVQNWSSVHKNDIKSVLKTHITQWRNNWPAANHGAMAQTAVAQFTKQMQAKKRLHAAESTKQSTCLDTTIGSAKPDGDDNAPDVTLSDFQNVNDESLHLGDASLALGESTLQTMPNTASTPLDVAVSTAALKSIGDRTVYRVGNDDSVSTDADASIPKNDVPATSSAIRSPSSNVATLSNVNSTIPTLVEVNNSSMNETTASSNRPGESDEGVHDTRLLATAPRKRRRRNLCETKMQRGEDCKLERLYHDILEAVRQDVDKVTTANAVENCLIHGKHLWQHQSRLAPAKFAVLWARVEEHFADRLPHYDFDFMHVDDPESYNPERALQWINEIEYKGPVV